ncbi:MAG: hypothetical protein GY696_18795 [Gammaproteobacteria bacterium]|nr:hypothetical protein [Gammaproteobacteria bacterium]
MSSATAISKGKPSMDEALKPSGRGTQTIRMRVPGGGTEDLLGGGIKDLSGGRSSGRGQQECMAGR